MIKMEMGSIIGRGMGGGGYPSTPYGYQELIIEPEIEVDELPMESASEPNVVSGAMEANDVEVIENAKDTGAVEKSDDPAVAEERKDLVVNVVKADDARSVGEPNAVVVEKPDVEMVDPNAIRAMLLEEARQDATGASGDDDIYRSMRTTAMLTIGLLAFVVILGVAILLRARRR